MVRLLLVALLAGAARAEPPPPPLLTSRAESGPVTVTVQVTPEAPVIGDAVLLLVEARAEAGVELLMPAFGEALGRFRITGFVPSEELGESGETIARQRYTLQASRSGRQSIPPLLVEFVDRRPGRAPAPEGADAYEVLTERIDFEVSSVLPEGAPSELRPPLPGLPPRRAPGGPWWPWLLGALLLVAAAFPWLLRALRARLAQKRQRSAYEVARAELDVLRYGPTPDARSMDAFFVKLSFVVRRYLEDRFGLRSPELTTEEFLEELSRSPDLTRDHRELLTTFLRDADLVKFAGHVPEREGVDAALDAASRFLDETREFAHA